MGARGFKLLFSSAACLLGGCGYCYFSGTPWFFSYVLMPSIKWVDPERAHRLGVCLAAKKLIPKERRRDDDILVRCWLYTLQDGSDKLDSQILVHLVLGEGGLGKALRMYVTLYKKNVSP